MRKISKIQEAFIKANAKKMSNQELADLYNMTFGTNITGNAMLYHKRKFNVLKERYGNGRKLKVGSERPKGDGFVMVKVAQPSVWKYKHRYIYEKAYGKIPKGHNVIFLDGDKTNFSLDNLALVENRVAMLMKSQGLMTNSKELTETGILIAEVQAKKNKLLDEIEDDAATRKEKQRIRAKRYYHNNKEKVRETKRLYRQANKEKNRIYQREWYKRKKLKEEGILNDT